MPTTYLTRILRLLVFIVIYLPAYANLALAFLRVRRRSGMLHRVSPDDCWPKKERECWDAWGAALLRTGEACWGNGARDVLNGEGKYGGI